MANSIVVPKVWRSEAWPLIGFVKTAMLSIYLSNALPWTVIEGTLFSLLGLTIRMQLPLLWFIPAGFLGVAIFRIYDVRYTIDGQGLETVKGILALNQRAVRVRYEDVRSVTTHQKLIDRLLDVGHVEIATAATSDLEIIFEGVGAPLEVHAMIETEKERRQKLAKKARANKRQPN